MVARLVSLVALRNVYPWLKIQNVFVTLLVICNTSKGKQLFDNIKNSLAYCEIETDKALIYNTAAEKSVPMNKYRNKFFNGFDNKSFDTLITKYCKDDIMIKVKKL